MKAKTIIIIVVLSFMVIAFGAQLLIQSMTGPHGGGSMDLPPSPELLEAATVELSIRNIEQLKFNSPDEAIALCRSSMARSVTSSQREELRRLLTSCLWIKYGIARDTRQFAVMDTIYREIVDRYPDSQEAGWAKRDRGRDVFNWAQEAVSLGDEKTAEHAFELALADLRWVNPMTVFEAFRKFRIEQSRTARRVGQVDLAMEYLMEAAAYPPFADAVVAEEILQLAAPSAMLGRAKMLATQSKHAQAMVYYAGAQLAAEQGKIPKLDDEEQTRIRREVSDCLVGVARKAISDRFERLPPAVVEQIYATVPSGGDAKRVLSMHEGLMEVRLALATNRIEDGEFPQAEASLLLAMTLDAGMIWTARAAADAGFDLWQGMPPAVADTIRKQFPEDRDQRRLEAIRLVIQQGDFVPPLPRMTAARRLAVELYTRWGQVRLGENWTDGADKLRVALRAEPTAEQRERIADALRQRMERAATDHHATAIIELAAFYAGELGMPSANDPFRDKLIGFLQIARRAADRTTSYKRVLMHSLLADLYAGEPFGQESAELAVREGLDLLAHTNPPDAPEQPVASGIKGASVLAVENLTPHQMLIVFGGSSPFTVRLTPYRRGSVVVRDGKHEVALVVVDQTGLSMRYPAEYASQYHQVRFALAGTPVGLTLPLVPGDRFVGDYTLLRSGDDAGQVKIDPRTGMAIAQP